MGFVSVIMIKDSAFKRIFLFPSENGAFPVFPIFEKAGPSATQKPDLCSPFAGGQGRRLFSLPPGAFSYRKEEFHRMSEAYEKMTVLALRRVAKEMGVKLGAGISNQ